MANPNFVATLSTNEVFRDQDLSRCLTDDLDTIDQRLMDLANEKVSSNFVFENYSRINHTHSAYALSSHSHSDYAPVDHTHSGFAAEDHTHTGYASSTTPTISGDITVTKTGGTGINLETVNGKSRVHKNANATSDYGTVISDYDAEGKRDYLTIRRSAASDANKLLLNSEDANGGSTKMYQIYGDHNKPGVLWKGSSFMAASQTVTPSKKLSECRTGWMLLWSDYDADTNTVKDTDFATTMIPRMNPLSGNWDGKLFLCDVPRFYGSDTSSVDTEKRIIKSVYIYDNKIEGHASNNLDTRTDVVLRAVYEF